MELPSPKTKRTPVSFIARAAVIAAVYFTMCAALSAISFGPIQFRLSESIVLLAAIMPEAIPGLTIGCILSNLAFSTMYDVIFGSLATFLGACGTYLLRKNIPLSALPPIIFNALLVPLIWTIDGGGGIYLISVLEIFISEAVAVGIIGIPLTYVLRRAFIRSKVIVTPIEALEYKREPRTDNEENAETETLTMQTTETTDNTENKTADCDIEKANGSDDGDKTADDEENGYNEKTKTK